MNYSKRPQNEAGQKKSFEKRYIDTINVSRSHKGSRSVNAESETRESGYQSSTRRPANGAGTARDSKRIYRDDTEERYYKTHQKEMRRGSRNSAKEKTAGQTSKPFSISKILPLVFLIAAVVIMLILMSGGLTSSSEKNSEHYISGNTGDGAEDTASPANSEDLNGSSSSNSANPEDSNEPASANSANSEDSNEPSSSNDLDETEESVKNTENYYVCVDPGHGGNDYGAVHNGVNEKDVNLAIALKVRDYLEEMGFSVIMTRETDETLVLTERSVFANNAGVDIFVSIHQNSSTSESQYGTETHIYSKDDPKGVSLGSHIQSKMVESLGSFDRGIYANSELSVLHRTEMTACLVECGFVSNLNESILLTSEDYQDKAAYAIASGIKAYCDGEEAPSYAISFVS